MAHTLLPIGEFEKPAVRAMAEEWNLPVFNKPDSQEICFVPNQDYAGLVKRRSPEAFKPGEIVDTSGAVVGRHEGHQHYTIGQRKGVGLAMGYPIYVVDINPNESRVTVGPREALERRSLIANQINILSDRVRLNEPVKCNAKIRYNHSPQPATLTRTGDDAIEVVFDELQSAVTPGQAVVCYADDVLLAGGWIDSATL
jgi:tRNA-specific 2-thiouridylase